jgi:hypothetical protein
MHRTFRRGPTRGSLTAALPGLAAYLHLVSCWCTKHVYFNAECRAQLQAVTAARILVGSHGAALTDVIAMEPGAAALLEVRLKTGAI